MIAPVEVVVSGDEALLQRFAALGRFLPIAIMRAANRAVQGARAELRRQLRARGIQAKYAGGGQVGRKTQRGGGVTIYPATPSNLTAVLRQEGPPLPLIAYLPRVGYRSGKGIAGLATVAPGYAVPVSPFGGFYATMATGHRGVFVRTRKSRGKGYGTPNAVEKDGYIREVYGPSLARVIDQWRLFEGLKPLAREIFERRMIHEAGRRGVGPGADDA